MFVYLYSPPNNPLGQFRTVSWNSYEWGWELK